MSDVNLVVTILLHATFCFVGGLIGFLFGYAKALNYTTKEIVKVMAENDKAKALEELSTRKNGGHLFEGMQCRYCGISAREYFWTQKCTGTPRKEKEMQ